MCWYLWVLIGSFPQQAQSQIAPELNMQALLQLKSTSARSFVKEFLRFDPWKFGWKRILVQEIQKSSVVKFSARFNTRRKLFWFNHQKINKPSHHVWMAMEVETFDDFFRNMSWIGFYLWWWWWWWWWWNVRMIVVCDFCRCDIFRVVAVHIRVGLMGPHVSDDPRAPHTK